LGLFSKRLISKDTIIGEFSGNVQQQSNSSSKNTVVLFSENDVTIEIDATRAGNETRFINDFRGKDVEPNVKYQQIRFGGCWRVFVTTIKDIEPNQEIIADLAPKWKENAAS